MKTKHSYIMIFYSSFSSNFLVPIIPTSFVKSKSYVKRRGRGKKEKERRRRNRGKKQEIKEKERKKNRKKNAGICQRCNLKSLAGYLHGHYYATGSVPHERSYFHELSYLIFKRTLLASYCYCSTLPLKPRPQKIQLLGSGVTSPVTAKGRTRICSSSNSGGSAPNCDGREDKQGQ